MTTDDDLDYRPRALGWVVLVLVGLAAFICALSVNLLTTIQRWAQPLYSGPLGR